MKPRKLSGILLLLSFVFSVSAQKADLTEQNLRKHVGYLASEQLEGRKTGEQGATFAAGYVANMFAQYKIQTGFTRVVNGKTQKSFLQPFPYVSGVELGRDNFLRIIPAAPAKENKMETGVNWMPVGFSANGYIPPAPLVFAGYGIVSNEAKYDDYANLDVKDKFVLVLTGTPDNNPRGQFARFNLHAKAKIAQEKGAKALIIISGENDFKDENLSRLNYDQTLGETAIPAAVITRSHGAEILGAKDANELAEIEKWLAKKSEAPENIRAKLANLPKAIAQLQVNLTKIQTAEAYNVIGILEGNDPVLKSEAIVIGAHYDHLGRGGRSSLATNSTEIHYGADDNASGVAAMLELARQFAQAKNNKRTLIFMAFGGEEEGLLGSKFYVNNPVFPLDKTVAMINLDMVGRLNEDKLTVGGIGTASEWKNWIEYRNFQQGNKADLTPVDLPNPKIPMGSQAVSTTVAVSDNVSPKTGLFDLQLNQDGFGPSDHSSFYGKQIPVLFFFTGTHADYHKPSDTAEKINYAGLLKITNYVGEIVHNVDQNPRKPTYTVAPSSGMGGRSGSFNVSLGTVPSYADNKGDGLLLDGVRDDSPAAKSGIKAGDKIVKMAGRDIKNISDYVFVLGEMKAGEEYEIIVMRGNEKLALKIVPAPRN
jgi:aminopeptidase YwaD